MTTTARHLHIALAAAATLSLFPRHIFAGDPAHASRELGRHALEAGQLPQAAEHLRFALALNPDSLETLELLLRCSASDRDARTLWSHAWTAASSDANGACRPTAEQQKLLVSGDLHLPAVASGRVAAVRELIRFADVRAKAASKEGSERVTESWARALAWELARETPALRTDPKSAYTGTLAAVEPQWTRVLRALEKSASGLNASGKYAAAIEPARILRGLCDQAGFDKLQGERPTHMEGFARAADDVLSKARNQLASRAERPWTIEELENLDNDQAEAFTRVHASWGNPGTALTPENRYRVETDCGHETLLAAATTLEQHHRRLARWFGRDPFADRPGLVRILAESTGLESEGSPFWWAGGFQSGDTTTVRLACGTTADLGRALTHELTHRFDGALYPRSPAWLVEGKAVWTAAAYADASDVDFVREHALFGTIEQAWLDGYGAKEKLAKLLDGTIEDYRDNYVAGYALYVYLASWGDAANPLFAAQIAPFQSACEKSKLTGSALFTAHFADGKQARPNGLDAFAKDFETFLAGFYWRDRKPFTKRYREQPTENPSAPMYVLDQPTWVWTRERAEPSFGEGQAFLAGRHLLAVGAENDAIEALAWSLSADGRRPECEALLAPALRKIGRADAAWTVEHRASFPASSAAPAPFLSSLPKTRALLAELEQASADYAQQTLPLSAAALRADRDRLASWLGVAPLGPLTPLVLAPQALHPFDTTPRPVAGWREAGLTGFEERRQAGLWFVDDEGDLHVGREKPRTGTGAIDRVGYQRDAVALGDDWILPGTWVLRAHIRFTTAYVTGAVVVGYTRRDRNVRFHFAGGDFLYSVGASDADPKFDKITYGATGLWERDRALPNATRSGELAFTQRTTGFDLELRVDGGSMEVWVEGQRAGVYHTADATPIEGYVGFALSYGAVEIQGASVQRLERSALAGVARAEPRPLDLSSQFTWPGAAVGYRVRGVEAPPQGLLLLLFRPPRSRPEGDDDRAVFEAVAEQVVVKLVEDLPTADPTQPVVLALPRAFSKEFVARLRAHVPPELAQRVQFAEHASELWGSDATYHAPFALFVDGCNVARCGLSYIDLRTLMNNDDFRRWLAVFRDHGQPPRDIAVPPRDGGADPPDAPRRGK